MGSAAKNLALPAVLEALAGVFMILRAQKFEFRHDEDGTGAALVGIGAIVFAQSMMVFSANPRRVPKGALIAFKAVLSLCAVYAVVTTATERKRAWAEWQGALRWVGWMGHLKLAGVPSTKNSRLRSTERHVAV
ncbi:unnamed protein product [Durusdinium trenchii]|uniref:Uncharacterized protein n=2 Tax=Durusdinium trenchii TaxID=1381693 RepID=A0ABP0MEU4_9DINO